jgi:hypothetical protein
MKQYTARMRMSATVQYGDGTAYWISACAGMTPGFGSWSTLDRAGTRM